MIPRLPVPSESPDLLIDNARLVATMDEGRRELAGGWVAIHGDVITGLGASTDRKPSGARRVLSADDCLVTPGLINTHHHLFQNLTRAWPPMTSAPLFGWLEELYPVWTANLDEEAVYLAAWVGLVELALSGCTTSADHHYLHPAGAGDLLAAEIKAATELGLRFHPTYGSMSVGRSQGGLPPDNAVQDEDHILAESQRQVERWHDPNPGAMVRIALAPCSPFSVSPELMAQTAELAEQLDVRLHTHLAENAEDTAYSLKRFGRRPVDQLGEVGWMTDRTWAAHVVEVDGHEMNRLSHAGVGVAHCPSSNMILSSGIAPVAAMRSAGVPVGLGCDGSSSADSASLWQEARLALLQAKLSAGSAAMTARDALEIATRGGAACLGREGELGQLAVGLPADLAVWSLTGPAFAGALADPIEAWLRCGPLGACHTVVAGRPIVVDGQPVNAQLEDRLHRHQLAAARFQQVHLS